MGVRKNGFDRYSALFPSLTNQHNSYLPTSERTKWLYISVSAAMTMQNVVNPTFWERKSEYRTDVLSVGPCSRNGYELCRLKAV